MWQQHFRDCSKKSYILALCVAFVCQTHSAHALDSAQSWQNLSIAADKAQRAAKLDEAERLYSKALVVAEDFGETDPRFSQSLAALAYVYILRGELDRAEGLCRRELSILNRLGGNYSDTGQVLGRLGKIKYHQENYPEAEKYLDQALVMQRKIPGLFSAREIIEVRYELACACQKQKKFAKAQPLFEEAVQLKRKVVRDDKWELREAILTTAGNLMVLGKKLQAEECLKELLPKEQYNDKREAARCYTSMANLYFNYKDYAKAEPLYKSAVAMLEKCTQTDTATPKDLAALVDSLVRLGNLYRVEGKGHLSEAYCEQALARVERIYSADDPRVANVSSCLGLAYQQEKKYESAERMFKRVIVINEKAREKNDPAAWRAYAQLAHLYAGQRRYVEAEPLYEKAVALKVLQEPDINLAILFYALADDMHYQHKYVSAEPNYRKALAIEEAQAEKQTQQLAHVISQLARVLGFQGKNDQAEPLFKRALQILANEPELKATYMGVLYQYSWFLRQTKRYKEADEIVAQAKKLEMKSKQNWK